MVNQNFSLPLSPADNENSTEKHVEHTFMKQRKSKLFTVRNNNLHYDIRAVPIGVGNPYARILLRSLNVSLLLLLININEILKRHSWPLDFEIFLYTDCKLLRYRFVEHWFQWLQYRKLKKIKNSTNDVTFP